MDSNQIETLVPRLLRRHRWQMLVFVTEFLYMGLELLASRVLAPYFGTTLDVWTAILGTVLLASAIGNHLGGKVADTDRCLPWLVRSLMVLMASFFVLPFLSMTIGSQMAGHITIAKTLIASLLLFAVPGICIGSVTPMVVALHGRENEDGVGRTSADVYVAMTLGGIAGTFLTGFVLVPVLGSTVLSYVMGAVSFVLACLLCIPACKATDGKDGRRASLGRVMLCVVVVSALGVYMMSPAGTTAGGDQTVDFWQDTQYGHVHVFERLWDGEPVRILNIDGGFESAMYTEPGREEVPVFDYVRTICDIVNAYDGTGADDGATDVLCLGGGAYSIPRNLVTSYDWRHVDVMEIDDGVTEAARKWFHLAEVEEKVGDRLSVISGDARVSMQDSDKSYDIVINDTFAGNVPVRTLATKEAAELVKSRLTGRGIYVANVIGKAQNDEPDMVAWEKMTLESVFKHVYVLPTSNADPTRMSNYIIVATDDDRYALPIGMDVVEIVNTAETRVLTDDDSPVEWIVSFDDK